MMSEGRQAHWDHIYETKAEDELSWYQDVPAISLELIRAAGVKNGAAVIDIGGGESRLVDALLVQGFWDLTVLDLSVKALAAAQARLASNAAKVTWIAADVTAWEPVRTYDLWHDRAAFHFLTEAAERQSYAVRVMRAVRPGGYVIIGTFAPDGPERCSGLPVMRHDAASIGAVLGDEFALILSRREEHVTPASKTQHFQFSLFQRKER
jgi:trans-aconitate methyltransferase